MFSQLVAPLNKLQRPEFKLRGHFGSCNSQSTLLALSQYEDEHMQNVAQRQQQNLCDTFGTGMD